jgi:hypothetical protein
VVVLAGMALGQEATFGKFGIGVGFGNDVFNGTSALPMVFMSGSYTTQNLIGTLSPVTNPAYGFFFPDSLKQAVAMAIPVQLTWRPINVLGVHLGTAFLFGGQTYRDVNGTFTNTTVDTVSNFVFTTTSTGSSKSKITGKISGFPFSLSLGPNFKVGDRILLEPEVGVAIFAMNLKGDQGTYTGDSTVTVTRHDTTGATHDTTLSSNRASISLSGKMPEAKISGLGTFWGASAEIMVHNNWAVKTGFRRGTASLKWKTTQAIVQNYQGGEGLWVNQNSSTTYQQTFHTTQVSLESYNLGLVYSFKGL